MNAVTKKSIIGDVLDAAPDTAVYFLEIGMHCLGALTILGTDLPCSNPSTRMVLWLLDDNP